MTEVLPLWVIEVMLVLFIPFAFTFSKGKIGGNIFIPALAMTIVFGIWTGTFPDYVVILPIVIMAIMLFGFSKSGSVDDE